MKVNGREIYIDSWEPFIPACGCPGCEAEVVAEVYSSGMYHATARYACKAHTKDLNWFKLIVKDLIPKQLITTEDE